MHTLLYNSIYHIYAQNYTRALKSVKIPILITKAHIKVNIIVEKNIIVEIIRSL